MDHLKGRVAVVTGASAGIGAATAIKLVKAGITVVGIARRLQRLQVHFNIFSLSFLISFIIFDFHHVDDYSEVISPNPNRIFNFFFFWL